MEREVKSTATKRADGRGKPRRRVSNAKFFYNIPLSEIIFRLDTICAIINQKYGVGYMHMKVLCAVDHMLKLDNLPCLSYHTIDISGVIRGYYWQEIVSKLHDLHELGLLEAFGKTKGGKYDKYRLSTEGDELVRWINDELGDCASLTDFQSKMFHHPAA